MLRTPTLLSREQSSSDHAAGKADQPSASRLAAGRCLGG
jgi:hypothetical protein